MPAHAASVSIWSFPQLARRLRFTRIPLRKCSRIHTDGTLLRAGPRRSTACPDYCGSASCAPYSHRRESLRQTTSDEYRVKAAFLFHFAQLVEWPAGAFTQDENDLSVCTIGGDPFEGQLESVLLGKVVGSRTLKVKHLKAGDDAKSCRILFIAMVDAKQVASLISAARKRAGAYGRPDRFLRA